MQIPDEAIKAVGNAIGLDEFDARAALEAAAPAMAGEIARKITRHMDDRWPSGCVGSQPARRHFRAAAQIAATAFYTDEDMKRMAAEALARGEAIVCDISEVPRGQ